jgi:dolichol kinase
VALARDLGAVLYIIFLGLFVLLEVSLRTGRNWNVPFASAAYRVMANDYELENKTLLGGVLICLSGLLLISTLNLTCAIVGILVLSYADSAASIVGKASPNHPIGYNKRKHFEGTAAFVAVAFAVTALTLLTVPMALPKVLGVSALIAVVCGLCESLPMKYYFDNFTVPIVAGLIAQLFLLL